jgi:4-hydroxyphenylpyruvate dioxygenase
VGLRQPGGAGELNIPAIKGVGDSLIYFVDRWRGKNGARPGDIGNIGFYDVDFEPLEGATLDPVGHGPALHRPPDAQRAQGTDEGVGRLLRAHLQFPRDPLLRHRGQVTGVKSRALTSPCGRIRIPINEEGNEKPGQISEYLDTYRGEGIQHIAMGARDLVRDGRRAARERREAPRHADTYYELIDKRIPATARTSPS